MSYVYKYKYVSLFMNIDMNFSATFVSVLYHQFDTVQRLYEAFNAFCTCILGETYAKLLHLIHNSIFNYNYSIICSLCRLCVE